MAVTLINLSDPVSSLVTKTNTISNDLGDVAQLATGDSNVVDAINTIKQLVAPFDDSAEILAIARNGLSINDDSALGLSLSYNTSTGIIKLIGSVDSNSVKSYFTSDSANGIGFNFGEGKFSIITSGVTEAKITSSAVTEAKIASSAVTEAKIASDAVTVNKIASSAVTEAKIASSAVTEAKIASSAVTEAKIASSAVTEAKIASSAVTVNKIAAATITSAKFNGAVSLIIYDDAGSVVKTIYSPGS